MVSGSPVIVVTPVAGVDTITQNIEADWTIGRCRVYAVDFVNGNDGNAGFADPASTSAGDYAIACALAGTRAKKTLAGLAAIFPRSGAGRKVEVVIANGGVNTEQSYADDLGIILSSSLGFADTCPSVRATGTNTTASAVAFDGSQNDVIYQGGITVPGLNVAGYNPNGATTTSLPCLKVGGAAPALPAEPAAPLGWRVRFDAATATATLRNQCRQIAAVTGGTTIVPQTAFGAAPGNTDVFYIEQAGVAIAAASTLSGAGSTNPGFATAQLTGVRFNSSVQINNAGLLIGFCGSALCFSNAGNNITITQNILHVVYGPLIIGGGMRATQVTIAGVGGWACAGLISATADFTTVFAGQLTVGNGCYLGTRLLMKSFPGGPGTNSNTAPFFGNTVTQAPARAKRLSIASSNGTIGGCVLEPSGANPAISVQGRCVLAFSQGVCSGTTGNNDVGLDLTLSFGSLIVIQATPTVTGALGDVRLAGGQIITWAQAIATGITDSQGNRIVGPAGTVPLGALKFSGTLLGGAGATLTYLVDAGLGLAANLVVRPTYPTSLRLFTRLRVTPVTNTAVNAVTATLYKNGVATAMTVNIPAGTTAKVVDSAHPILFADGDDFDLRLDDGAADVGAVVNVSALLEYPI